MKSAIQVCALKKSYDGHMVLKGLNLQIEKGEIFALLGINGAGKTTALECMEGLRKYDSGTISVNGKTGIQLQSASLPAHIKPLEAIKLFSKWNRTTADEPMLDALGIREIKSKQYCQLSTGQKRRLHLMLALTGNPDIVFLDEPTAGLDPVMRGELLDRFLDYIQDENHSILLSSHITTDLEQAADSIAYIHKGKLLFQEDKDLLLQEYGVLRCSEADRRAVPAGAVVFTRRGPLGCESLVKGREAVRAALPSAVCDPARIDDIMRFYAGRDHE